MNDVLDDLQQYIDERIIKNNYYFKKNNKLQKLTKETYNIYEKICNENSDIPMNVVKKIFDNLVDISAEENYISYRIGLIDGITINENLQKS